MAGRVAGGVVDAHSTSNSSYLGSGLSYHTEFATWGEEKAAILVLDTIKR